MNTLSNFDYHALYRRIERFFPIIIIGFLLLGLLMFIFNYSQRLNTRDTYLDNISILQGEINDLEAQKAHLESELEYARSDAAVEAWAGGTARMAKPGEKLIIPIEQGEPVIIAPEAEPIVEAPAPNYESWVDLILNR